MDLGLKDKVAIITGTGSQIGFGKAIALALAKEGCDIMGVDVDGKGAEQTAAEVRSLGRKAIGLKVDITNRAEVDAAVKKAFFTAASTSARLVISTFKPMALRPRDLTSAAVCSAPF